ncbi:MAG: hypothetical protein ACRDDX_10650 [Cellulosilyticaceae bacterium]
MKFESIIKKLGKDGYVVDKMEFDHVECFGVSGTALIDVTKGTVVHTTAKYNDVVVQIDNGMSHINNINGNKKSLSVYKKYNG